MKLEFNMERSVLIRARRRIVFSYFTDSNRWAAWWGAGSTIDPRPGGRVSICYPNGVKASGEVVSIEPLNRLVFTLGYDTGTPVPPGGSLVTIRLSEEAAGTRLDLLHEFESAAIRDQHVQGWRYQLALFGNVVADEVNADAVGRTDAWFEAWSEPNQERRDGLLDRTVCETVRFSDRFSMVVGLADLRPHLAAVHVYMPGMRITRTGAVRHCQSTALAEWVARGADGNDRGKGTNVFRFDADGRIEEVVGFWELPAATGKAGSS